MTLMGFLSHFHKFKRLANT